MDLPDVPGATGRPHSRVLLALTALLAAVAVPTGPPPLAGQDASPLTHRAELVQDASAMGRPWVLAVGPEHHLYATYPLEGEVRVLDPSGRHMQAIPIAAAAEPDSFPRWVGWVDDTLWLMDFRTSVVVFFDDVWRPIRSRPIVRPGRSDGVYFDRPLGLLSDDRLVIETAGTGLAMATGDGEKAPNGRRIGDVSNVPVWIAGPDGSVLDTLVSLSTRHQLRLVLPGSGPKGMVLLAEPFRDSPLVATNPNTSLALVVDRAVRTERSPVYSVRRISALNGDTLSTRDYPYDPVAMTAEWRDAALDQAADRLGVDRDEGRQLAEEALFLPPWLPPVSEVHVGPDGSAWLRREDVPNATTRVWDILDHGGYRVGSVELAATLRVRAVDGLIAWATEEVDRSVHLWRVEVTR